MTKYKIELEDKLNKPDFDILADLMSYYDKYEHTADLSTLKTKINEIHTTYIDSLQKVVNEAKEDIKDDFQQNNKLISNGKETWYNWHGKLYDKHEYTRKLTKKEIASLKQQNKIISKINLKLTDLWLKLLKCRLVINKQ